MNTRDDSSNLSDLSREKDKKNIPVKNQNANISQDEALERLRMMQEQHLQLKKQLEEAFQRSGLDPSELTKYCENPNNFTPAQWANYVQRKEEMEMLVTGLTKQTLEQKKELKTKARVDKERRGKTLGSRKNWLNMH